MGVAAAKINLASCADRYARHPQVAVKGRDMDRTGVLAEKRGRTLLGVAMRAGSLLAALLTTGCMATIQGGPDRLYSVSDEVAQARYLLEEASVLKVPDGTAAVKGLINSYYAVTSDNDRKFYRNEVIARRMYIIDVQYSEYEGSLTRDRQLTGFLTSIANQGLSVGSTLAAHHCEDHSNR